MIRKLSILLAVAAFFAGGCGGTTRDGAGGGDGGGSAAGGGGSGGGVGGAGVGGVGGIVEGPIVPTDKVDLLLVVDNSISMADKQALLGEAVPRLVNRLVKPPPGSKPVTDLHIGVITSSLGGHGADQCSSSSPGSNPAQYDNAHLVGSGIRPAANLTSYGNLGFLWWDPLKTGGGETDVSALITELTKHVMAAGESGCGFEAPLEAWYRFLVDPTPPLDVVVKNNEAISTGVDQALLAQRKAFLRPDSAVAIVLLTDENDCSIVDGGINWIAGQVTNPNFQAFHLPRATAACASDPNSPCCRSCAASEPAPPAGCAPIAGDPECAKGAWDDVGDHLNLRCWDQKRRFGVDFLYPTRRYAEALTQPTICTKFSQGLEQTKDADCAGERVQNPLFAEGRDPRLVFLLGIVGVPWQDLATGATLNDPKALTLIGSSELAGMGRWDWLAPECTELVSGAELPRPMPICKRWNPKDSPNDPFLIESTTPRTGANPALGQGLAPPSSGPMSSAINGHEWMTDGGDLQYACIMPLAVPRDCAAPFAGPGCDCDGDPASQKNPLCQDASGAYTSTQRFAKAYPGVRQLEVMRDIGAQAVVASICPKAVAEGGSTAYGYNAAMDALGERLGPVLK